MAAENAAAPLAGLRVLDLSTVVAGPFGTEILGYLGADVVRVDPPPTKPPPGPAPREARVSEAEGFTWALARNKRSVCLDLKSPAGHAAFLDLVRASDVVYDNFRPGVTARLAIDHASLARVNPRIVCCSISGFGARGPWAQVGAYDVAVQALGGSMSITGTGRPGDMPCRLGVPIGDIAGSLYAVIGVLGALAARDRDGHAQAIDLALLDVQLALNTYRVPQTFGAGRDFGVPSPRRGGAGATPYGPFRAGDGRWIVLGVASNHWPAFCRTIAREDWLHDTRFATLADRQRNQDALDALVEARMREASAGEWEARLAAAGVPAARVNEIHEAFAHPQAIHRRMTVRFTEPSGRVVQAAASPIRFAGVAQWPQRPPVDSGADTDAVLAEYRRTPRSAAARSVPGVSSAESAASPASERGRPLAGIRVLEFCGDEPSGTLGTQILADLGATVLKIERPPSGDPAPTPVPRPGEPVEAGIAYMFGLNRGKQSACIDLKSDLGRALAHALAGVADVIYDNYKPGVMSRLGLDAATLRALKPELICASVSGYGQDGPWASQPAYDATVQAAGGAMSITGTGDPEAPPVRWGNPIGGIGGALYAVIGVLAALHRRRHGGGGATLDIALFDAQLAMHAYRVPPALDGARYTASPRRGGSGAMPYGPFLAKDERWFVLGITGQFWAKACDALEHPQWRDDPRFVDEAARRANEAALNEAVARAMHAQTADEWQRRFVALGIPGAKVLNIREAFEHPHVALREMLAGFDHPIGRYLKVAGDPIRYAGAPPALFAPPPALGADTRKVLSEWLGRTATETAALRAARTVWWSEAGEVYGRPSVV